MSDKTSEKINFTSLSKDKRRKVHFLLIEADARLELASRHNCEARDLLGLVSHLVEGVDVREFCRDDEEEKEEEGET